MLNKLFISDKNLHTNLQLAAYFYRIKARYSKFVAIQKLSAKKKILKLSIFIVEFEDKKT